MTRVEVSVVICVLNGAATIRRQLDALDAQRGHPPFDVLVVDNGSTDATPTLIAEWQSRPGAPTRKLAIEAHERRNIPYARNVGAMTTTGRIIAYCDADDRVDPAWVKAIADCLSGDGILGGRIEGVSPRGEPKPDTFPHGLTRTPYLPHGGNCNLAITRSCFDAIGGYDETLPRYGFEDVDICWRAQEAGFPMTYCPEAVVYFSISPKTKAIKKEFLIAQARVAMAHRHPGAYQGFTLPGTVAHLARTTALLPVRLARPGASTRSRHVRHFIDACGFMVGYLKYGPPPRSAKTQRK
ncbi:glycosyltransferase [Tessaracoccus sp. MC1627]|uniref:glycosyltransferase family 2 protein n=1 Tax=Tessaracoccus sp. MC1627 TaxID=2760312 RepID=UPI001601395F|nr:glycosyltransferase [Tessaracoccus sp. MC1627]MBB1513190.1 glycosyltransferase [Tessaracoccus sp. MC1627]MBB1513477.1 glycosyltransferase [Tessaracoccus sp. MC1627]